MEWWGTLLISLATALVGSIASHFLTVNWEKRKQKREELAKIKEAQKQADAEKPRLEILNYIGFENINKIHILREEKSLNILALGILGFEDKDGRPTFIYDDKALNSNHYDCVEYYFVNSGKTEIQDICFTSNIPRTMALFNLDDDKQAVKNHLLNYAVWHEKRYIKPGERVLVRIYYIKDMIPTTSIGSAEIIIWLRGVNGFIWRQTLYSPSKQIEYPVMSDEVEFKETRDTSKAIECFKNPIMW